MLASIVARPQAPPMKSAFRFYIRLVFAWMFVLIFALMLVGSTSPGAARASSSCPGCC